MKQWFEKALKFLWQGENKWVTLLFGGTTLVYAVNYLFFQGKSSFLNFLSPFLTGLTVSSFFEISTRNELLKETRILFEKYIKEVAVPQDEDIKLTILNYIQYLNTSAFPYEDERLLIFKLKDIINDNIVNFEIISKFKFNSSLREEKEIKRTFTLVIPKYILSSLNINCDNTKCLRKYFLTKCLLSSREVNLEDIIVREEEKIWKEADIIRYSVPLKIPLTKGLEPDNFHLQLVLNYFAPLEDYFVITFNTFCKKFRLEIHFEKDTDQRISLTIKPDTQDKNPLVGKCTSLGNISSHYEELECKNILPGTKFIIDWKRKNYL